MSIAYENYSNPSSVYYCKKTSNILLEKTIYTGNNKLLFEYALSNIECKEESIHNKALKCLQLSAKSGYIKAIRYCQQKGIKYN